MSNVAKTSPAYDRMLGHWQLVDALLGGTTAMRDAGALYLPKWPREEDEDYKRRLAVATLFPAFSETIANMVGRVFAEEITVADEVPGAIKEQMENIDLSGNNLNVWAKSWFEQALGYGLSYALVDFPRVDGLKTKADEKAAAVRPYVVMINPKQIIGWKTVQTNNGPLLVQVRIVEEVEVDDGEYGVKSIRQIRVLMPGKCEIWRKAEQANTPDEWIIFDQWAITLSIIPLIPLYTRRTGFMMACPPLLELAHLNVKHWQSQSDQDTLLHTARVPILALIGVTEGDDSIVLGASHALHLPQGADAKFVEHSGAAIGSGHDALEELKEQMRQAGAKLLRKDNQASKTEGQSDEEKAQDVCALTTMANALSDALENILQLFADWQKLGNGGTVNVHNDFGDDPSDDIGKPQTITALVGAFNSGLISKETFLFNLQTMGLLPEDRTIEEELELLDVLGATPTGGSQQKPIGKGKKDPVENGGE